MGSPSPNVSRDNFDIADLYMGLVLQQGVPVFDNDLNELMWMGLLRQSLSNRFASLDAQQEAWSRFSLTAGGVANSFQYLAGQAFWDGVPFPHPYGLQSGGWTTSREYEDTAAANQNRITDIVVSDKNSVTGMVEDENRVFKTEHYLVGCRLHMVTGAEVGNDFTIASYTGGTSQLTIPAGSGIVAGDRGIILPPVLTTPSGGDRTDDVYLQIFYEWQNSVEDEDIDDPVLLIESVHKLRCRVCLRVDEGQAGGLVNEASTNSYDPRIVRFIKVAQLARLDTVATISTVMVTMEIANQAPLSRINAGWSVNHVSDTNDADDGFHKRIDWPDANLPFVCVSASERLVQLENAGAGTAVLELVDGSVRFQSAVGPHLEGSGSQLVATANNASANAVFQVENADAVWAADIKVKGDLVAAYDSGKSLGGTVFAAQEGEFKWSAARTFYKRFSPVSYFQRTLHTVTGGGALLFNVGGATPAYWYNNTAAAVSTFYLPVGLFGVTITSIDIYGYLAGAGASLKAGWRTWDPRLAGQPVGSGWTVFTPAGFATWEAHSAGVSQAAPRHDTQFPAGAELMLAIEITNSGGAGNESRLADISIGYEPLSATDSTPGA